MIAPEFAYIPSPFAGALESLYVRPGSSGQVGRLIVLVRQSMPTRPFEVMIGKIVPYILMGYVQIGLFWWRRVSYFTCRWPAADELDYCHA